MSQDEITALADCCAILLDDIRKRAAEKAQSAGGDDVTVQTDETQPIEAAA